MEIVGGGRQLVIFDVRDVRSKARTLTGWEEKFKRVLVQKGKLEVGKSNATHKPQWRRLPRQLTVARCHALMF